MIIKEIEISGVKVAFKSSAAVPRLYRAKFQRDVFKDFGRFCKGIQYALHRFLFLRLQSGEQLAKQGFLICRKIGSGVIPPVDSINATTMLPAGYVKGRAFGEFIQITADCVVAYV